MGVNSTGTSRKLARIMPLLSIVIQILHAVSFAEGDNGVRAERHG